MSIDPKDLKPDDDTSEELTPADKKKFGKFLDDFLAEDTSTAPPTPGIAPVSGAASTGNSPTDLTSAINAALDAREGKTKDSEWRAGIEAKLATLTTPKKKKWWEAWTLFSG